MRKDEGTAGRAGSLASSAPDLVRQMGAGITATQGFIVEAVQKQDWGHFSNHN